MRIVFTAPAMAVIASRSGAGYVLEGVRVGMPGESAAVAAERPVLLDRIDTGDSTPAVALTSGIVDAWL